MVPAWTRKLLHERVLRSDLSGRAAGGDSGRTASGMQQPLGFRSVLQQQNALCLCCLAQIAIEGSQRQLVAAGEL
jgi:hypothetical protein